jgi:hypothetical protein
MSYSELRDRDGLVRLEQYPQRFDYWTTMRQHASMPHAPQPWRDRFEFQCMALAEGICPVCRESLEPYEDRLRAGLCHCCGYAWIVRTATPQEAEAWQLTEEEDRRVITTERAERVVIDPSRYFFRDCHHDRLGVVEGWVGFLQ